MPPNPPAMPIRRKSPLGFMIAVLFVIAALVLGYVIGLTKGQKAGYAKGSADAQAEAQQKIADSPFVGGRQQEEVRTINGVVTAVAADSFTINATQTVTNPLAEQAPTVRTVRLAEGAFITLMVERDAETYQAEVATFRAASRDVGIDDTAPTPPERFESKTIALSDLKEGMRVTVNSDENLLTAASFTATSVRAQEAAPVQETNAGGNNEPAPDAPRPNTDADGTPVAPPTDTAPKPNDDAEEIPPAEPTPANEIPPNDL